MLFLSSEFLLDTFNYQVSLYDRRSYRARCRTRWSRWGWRDGLDLGLTLPDVDLTIDNYFVI